MIRSPKIFLSYAKEWQPTVETIYEQLKSAGCRPWMDKKDILAGETWKESISKAIKESDIFLTCITKQFQGERRFLQREIKIALDVLQEISFEQVFIIPMRLKPHCEVPRELQEYQWNDYFAQGGIQKLVQAISKHCQISLISPPLFDTWYKTPVNLEEFSPITLKEVDKAKIELFSILTTAGELTWKNQAFIKKINTQTAQLSKNPNVDIEIMCLDENRRYVIHPWAREIGVRHSDIWDVWKGKDFTDWFWHKIEEMNSGYLTWIDAFSSQVSLFYKIHSENWENYRRKTIASFLRVQNMRNGYWLIEVEGHEVAKIM